MIVPRLLLYGASVLLAVAVFPATCRGQGIGRDTVCGPRCVQFVLKEFGLQTDLLEIVLEMQWPKLEEGSSLAAIQHAIERRGLAARALSVPSDCTIQTEAYVVMHVNCGRGSITSDAGGHFIVLVPPKDGIGSYYWDGLHGSSLDMPSGCVPSGYILLVARDRSQCVLQIRRGFTLAVVVLLSSLAVLAGYSLYCVRTYKRTEHRCSASV